MTRGLRPLIPAPTCSRAEQPITVYPMPPIHKDPFDRMLVAQSMVEGMTLVTTDPLIAQFPGPVHRV